MIADALSWLLILGGGGCVLVGGIGVIRLPDFYSRLHAAGLTDTLGAALTVLGLIVQSGWTLVSVKLAIILVVLFFASPTGSHALAAAARASGLPVWPGTGGRP
ncbi:MAG: sodium:proton antiporter [Alphaproteobacteria bacterium]|nr:sodium:proton antiporter [Alphaproteobacteria bacterium]